VRPDGLGQLDEDRRSVEAQHDSTRHVLGGGRAQLDASDRGARPLGAQHLAVATAAAALGPARSGIAIGQAERRTERDRVLGAASHAGARREPEPGHDRSRTFGAGDRTQGGQTFHGDDRLDRPQRTPRVERSREEELGRLPARPDPFAPLTDDEIGSTVRIDVATFERIRDTFARVPVEIDATAPHHVRSRARVEDGQVLSSTGGAEHHDRVAGAAGLLDGDVRDGEWDIPRLEHAGVGTGAVAHLEVRAFAGRGDDDVVGADR
jgi:hypothetical protein